MYLSKKNAHSRDSNIIFIDKGHQYIILTDKNSTYKSVTTWNKEQFPKFQEDNIITNIIKKNDINGDYYNMTHKQIKAEWEYTKNLGTKLHNRIEKFMNINTNLLTPPPPLKLLSSYNIESLKPLNNIESLNNIGEIEIRDKQINILNIYNNVEEDDNSDSISWDHFISFINDYPNLRPYRTEWLIYDDILKIAGSIDMVYENDDGTLEIYDWKRSKNISYPGYGEHAIPDCIKHLPDCNYIHYSLQLHTYKMILETKYNKKVTAMYLIRLHPNGESYDRIPVHNLNNEVIMLAKLRINELYSKLL
jgi:hypothetical protein